MADLFPTIEKSGHASQKRPERRSCSTVRRYVECAKIIIDPKSPVDCRIADYSAGGACIEIRGETRLPNRFELVFGRSRKRCRIVWSKGRRMGLVF
jgi:hypothetical protein